LEFATPHSNCAIDSKLPISVCLISGAEAARISKALTSVAGWTSEIIVVLNQEVSDGTDQIASSFGAKVFREPWKGFAAQKNSAAEKASQPWLLGLDADEAISDSLRDEIRALFASGATYSACSFPRCTFYLGRWIKHGDWYPDRCIRLWQRGKARWSGEDPHPALQVDGPVEKLRQPILHYTAETPDQMIAKTERYAEDFARQCLANGRRVGTVDILFRPSWRFFRAYVLRLGFLDGRQGYTIARMAAFYTKLRYTKAREAQAGLKKH
jgi:glycosyltransferase involved in cell wall biosynthesis